MSNPVYLGKRQLSPELLCEHVSTSQLLPQLLREIVIDEILAQWQPESEPQLAESETKVDPQTAGLAVREGMNESQLMAIATRQLKLEQFKREAWGHRLGSYYLNRKAQLDRAICSVMQVDDSAVAQELFFRIQSGEKSFAELAFKYSQGPEARDGGKLGPIPVASLHPDIHRQIVNLQPGELSPLFTVSNFYIFVRLEELIPAQFDDNLRQLLLDELFEKWLQDRIAREIGLVSVQTNVLPPDFMTDNQHFDRELVSGSLGLLTASAPDQKFMPTDVTPAASRLERGDTEGLLSQLSEITHLSSESDPVATIPAAQLESVADLAPLESGELEIFTQYSTSSFFLPQTATPAPITYINDQDYSSYRWIWISTIAIITLAFGVAGFYYLQSTGSVHQSIEQTK